MNIIQKKFENEINRFKNRNRKLEVLIVLFLLGSVASLGLWLVLGGNLADEDFSLFFSSQWHILFSMLIPLPMMFFICNAIEKRSLVHMAAATACLTAFLFVIKGENRYKQPQIKLEHHVYQKLEKAVESADYAAIERILVQEKASVSPKQKLYVMAQLQIRSGKPAAYLQKAVVSLRSGDTEWFKFNPRVLARLETAYDGKVLSAPAREHHTRRLWLPWCWLPLACTFLWVKVMGKLRHRERTLDKIICEIKANH